MPEPTESKAWGLLPKKKAWEAKTSAELKAPADQVWPLLADFCNLCKYFPMLATSYQVGGDLGQPGLIRYCQTPPTDPADETTIKWVREMVLLIDPTERLVFYEMIENNMGFHDYFATMQAVPKSANDHDGACGCRIEWCVVCEPTDGWAYEDLTSFLESSFLLLAETMDAFLSSTTTTC